MAASSALQFLLIFISFSCFIFTSQSQSQSIFKPNKLILSVQKDTATHLYVTKIQKRTPQLQVPFVVDLNGQFMWVTCGKNYLSTTYRAPYCNSTQCLRANSHYCFKCASKAQPGCHNNTCGLMAVNPVTHQATMGELAQDVLTIPSATKLGSQLKGPMVKVPHFLFVCAPSTLLQRGLPKNAQGVVGLGHAPIALPNQLASNFGFPPKFSICLPSATSHGVVRTDGFALFGEGPSLPMSYTPLIMSRQGEYYMQISSIKINNNLVPLDPSLLSIDRQGNGGTMISTTTPYTLLHHSIYQAFTKLFTTQFSSVPQVKPVAPFGVCYDSKKLASTKAGPGVPKIDLVLQNPNVKWTVFGANSMVQAQPGVMCLAFVDGGLMSRASIVIGGHQLQDNVVQFDLARSRLGLSPSLLLLHTSCANFNFSSSP